jgi:hypothetical protein
MDLSVQGDEYDRWSLLNIRSQISPRVTVMSADFSSWAGNNFTTVFSSAQDPTKKTGLMIGANLIPIDCPVPNFCAVTDTTKLPKNPGIMYLAALNQRLPLLQINSDGSTQPISFQPPKNNNPSGSLLGTTNPADLNLKASPPQIQNTIVLGGTANK